MRYVLYPGPVVSKVDGSELYLSGVALSNLYRVPYRNCVVAIGPAFKPKPGDVELRPRQDGDYSIESAIKRSP